MAIATADANLTGTVPSDLGRVLVDLQMFNVRDNPGMWLEALETICSGLVLPYLRCNCMLHDVC